MTEVGRGDPLRPRRGARPYRSRGGFKTVELNAAGWSALIGTGVAAGTAASLTTRTPFPASVLVGIVGTWAGLVALDHRRWRNSIVSLSRDLSEDTYRGAVERLRSMGISTSYRELVDDETGDRYGAIECRQADLDAAERVLDEVTPYL